MKIINKRQAMTLYRQHPAPDCFASVPANINGPAGICHYAGQEVQDIRGVLAVFAERRQDRNGPYVILFEALLLINPSL